MCESENPRVIFIGDSGVGKTSIIHRIKNGLFEYSTTPTIGAGITLMNVEIDGKNRQYQLWDTAGQEIYRNIVPIYFKGAVCAIVVFSLTDKTSFESVESWIEQLHANSDPSTGIIIVGNKCDCENLEVYQCDAKKWAESHNQNIFFASAATGECLDLIKDYFEQSYVIPALKNTQFVQPALVESDRSNNKQCC